MADLRTVEVLVTSDSLRRDLAGLGVEPGMTVLVHVSLSSLGCVVGGEQAVVAALRSLRQTSAPTITAGSQDPTALADDLMTSGRIDDVKRVGSRGRRQRAPENGRYPIGSAGQWSYGL